MATDYHILGSSSTDNGATAVSTGRDQFTVELKSPLVIPSTVKSVNVSVISATIPWTCLNVSTGVNDKLIFQRSGDAKATEITLEPGLYDVRALNRAVNSILVNAAFADQSCVISGDSATQKATFTLLTGMSMSFSATSPYALLGCLATTRFPETKDTFTTTQTTYYAPNVADFGNIASFLIHSDLVTRGITYSNYIGVLADKPIDRSPGSILTYEPLNPLRIDASQWIGHQIDRIKFWLTDQNNNAVDLNANDWTVLIRIETRN